jgi:ABC-type amino acid transport substrate-binding protein
MMWSKNKSIAYLVTVMLLLVFTLSACGTVKPSAEIKTPEDLKGKKVGCQVSTTAHDSLKKYLETIKFDLTTYDQIIETFSELKTGRLDAIVVDEVVAKYYVTTDPSSYKVTGARLTNEPIGAIFRKTDAAMRDTFNKTLEEMRSDGSLKEISMKWFGDDLTSNLKLPEGITSEEATGTAKPDKNGFEGKKVLKVGVDDTYPPMEYRDDKNALIGFDIDVAKAMAKKLNLEIEFVPTQWDGIFAALNANKYDCIISSCSMNEERVKNYAMSKPYISNAQVIVVKPSK